MTVHNFNDDNQDVKKHHHESDKSENKDMVVLPAILSDKDRKFFNKVIDLLDNLQEKRQHKKLSLDSRVFSYQEKNKGNSNSDNNHDGNIDKASTLLLLKQFKKSLKQDLIANYPANMQAALTKANNEYEYQMDLYDAHAQSYLLPEIAKLKPDFHQFVALYKTWNYPLNLHRVVLSRIRDKKQFAQIFVLPMYYPYALHSYLNHPGFLGNQLAFALNCYQRDTTTEKFSEKEIITMFFDYLENNPEIRGKINHFQILKDFKNILSDKAIHQIIEQLGENANKPLLTLAQGQADSNSDLDTDSDVLEINYASLYRSGQFENLDEIGTFLFITEKELKKPLGMQVLQASMIQLEAKESNECVCLHIQAKPGMSMDMSRIEIIFNVLIEQAKKILFLKEEKMTSELDSFYEEVLRKHLFYFNLNESLNVHKNQDNEDGSKQFKI
jgi:hypothetical protein